jgi:predicted PurR-regulated permease PerM
MRRPLTPLTLLASLLASAAVVWLVPQLLGVLYTIAMTVVFALLLDAPVSALVRRGVPRGAALGAVVALAMAALVGVVLALVPAVAEQLRTLLGSQGDLAQLSADRVNELLSRLPFHVEVDRDGVVEWTASLLAQGDSSWVRGLGRGLTFTLVAAVAAVWTVAAPDALAERLLRFIPPERRERTRELCGTIERRLRRWVVGQATVMLAVGVGTYVVLRLLGVPFAELFALIALVMEAVPTVGVFLAAAGPALMLLVDDPSKLVWLLVGIMVVQQLEDRLLVPVVIGKVIQVPPAMLLICLLAAGTLFGLGGMVLTAPLLAAAVALHDELTLQREPAPEPDPGDGPDPEPAA